VLPIVSATLVALAVVNPLSTGTKAQGTPVNVWVTTADQSRLIAPQPPAAFAAPAGSLPLTITVDDRELFQRMVGFGASLTESSAWLLYNRLPVASRTEWMGRLFDPVDGIGLSFLRQPIGASDFSLSHYSYDDVPYGETDYPLARYSVARDDAYVFPAVRDAIQHNPQLSVMISAWSPPGWMKTSGTMIGGALRPEAYSVFASYLVKTVQAYGQRGIPVESLTLQNEPHFVPEDYPGMYIEAPEAATLIGQYVGPALQSAGLSARIFAWDHNWNEPEYPMAVLQDARAARYASGAAFHCYGGEPEAMSRFHDAFPSMSVYMTECSTGAWSVTRFDTGLYENMRLLIRSTRNWAGAVAKWNVALDETGGPHTGGCTTCSALLTIDSRTGSVSATADYYALAHFSKFVHPGARRVASTTSEAQGLESSSFVNTDGSHVLVVWNGWGARPIRVAWNGAAFDYQMPGEAAATFVWSGDAVTAPPAGRVIAVPGIVEAEDFGDGQGVGYADDSSGNSGGEYRSTDVDIQRTYDAGGGYNVGWIDPGEWLAYPIDVGAAGRYQVDARLAANGPGGRFHIEIDGTSVSGALNVPDTGGWQNWTTLTVTGVQLPQGRHTLRVVFDANGPAGILCNLNFLRLAAEAPPSPSRPVVAVPGIIEAEDFGDGQGVGYADDSPGNSGGEYRSTDVDIQRAYDAGGGYNVGWIDPGEWLAYPIDVEAAGSYQLDARVAADGPGGRFHIEIDDNAVSGPLNVPNTGGWQNWTTLTVTGVQLPQGRHTLRVVFDANGPAGIVCNLNYVRVAPATAASSPFRGTPSSIPGVIQAENFDEGADSVAFHDAESTNVGGQYRQTGVDIEVAADTGGGYNVGWMTAGEWLVYTVDTAATGTYTIDARVAANGSGGTFHIEVNGTAIAGPFVIPNTNGWQNWTTLSQTGVRLDAGRQTLRVVLDANGPNGTFGNLNYLTIH
jgi:glucosylceramidase